MKPGYRTDAPREMEAIGLDIGETNKRNLSQRRTKRGECPTCGIRTHKITMFGKKTPLTVKGECLAGICLRCNAIEGYQTRPAAAPSMEVYQPPRPAFPAAPSVEQGYPRRQAAPEPNSSLKSIRPGKDIIVDDNISTVSGLTMDNDLMEPTPPAARWRPPPPGEYPPYEVDEDQEESLDVPPPVIRRLRPEASVADSGIAPQYPNRPPPSFMEMDQIRIDLGGTVPRRNGKGRREDHSVRSPARSRPPLSVCRDNMVPVRPAVQETFIERDANGESNGSSEILGSRITFPTHIDGPLVYPDDPLDLSIHGERYSDEEEKNEIEAHSTFRPDPWPQGSRNEPVKPSRDNWDMRGNEDAQDVRYADPVEMVFSNGGLAPRNKFGSSSIGHGYNPARPRDVQFVPNDFEGSRKPAAYDGPRRFSRSPISSPPPLLRRDLRGKSDGDNYVAPITRRISPPHPRHQREYKMAEDVTQESGPWLSDIPFIIRQLHENNTSAKLREDAFRSLADLIWREGNEAKILVARNQGVKAVVQSMWADLSNPELQVAAVEFLFALSASADDSADSDVLVGESARSAVDALLISMQTHCSVESLQRSGCGALSCLASASNENKMIDDGTLSGAVSCVVAAMDAHRKSAAVQKWGLRALYCQCLLSANAENNRMSLARDAPEAGGMSVIYRAMDVNEGDLVCTEWGCRLYWCLAFSPEIGGILTQSSKPTIAILKALHFYEDTTEGVTIEEAAYGALVNMDRAKRNHGTLREAGLVARIFQSMDNFKDDVGVNIEACALLGDLAETNSLKEAIVTYNGVERITHTMGTFPDDAVLQEEALRALLCLSIDCDEAKANLSSAENIELLMSPIIWNNQAFTAQELTVSLAGSLCLRSSPGRLALFQRFGPMLVKAMNQSPGERRLQEAVSLAWRNLTRQGAGLDDLQVPRAIPSLVHVMKTQADSETVQINLCCALWNLATRRQKEIASTVDASCINQVVAVIQSHIESAAAVEMACGALWSLIVGSEDRKRWMAESGGVDFVKSALLLHPQAPNTLEMACGVLSSLSGTASLVDVVADAQGISNVVETMRNNTSSLPLLEIGCLVLRNIVVSNSDYASEASNGISTIIAAMRENVDAVTFLKEASWTLWAMAAMSDDCKQKILALDGLAVIRNSMNHNMAVSDLQEAGEEACIVLAESSDDRS